MLTVTLLCAVFTAFTIPTEWRAVEMKNLADRATIKLERQVTQGAKLTIPTGCWPMDETSGVAYEPAWAEKPAVRIQTYPAPGFSYPLGPNLLH